MQELDYVKPSACLKLSPFLQFRHRVNGVTPIADGKWKVEVTDLINQKTTQEYFDAVVVCIG